MAPIPECGTMDTPIVDSLHTMHDRKFLHLPVVDRDRDIVAVVNVIHIAHAAIAAEGSRTGGEIETASSMMQNFLDFALSLQTLYHDDDSQSEGSTQVTADTERSSAFYPLSDLSSSFGFKLEDKQQRMHRFNCETHSLADLITCILQRVGDDIDRNHLPQILYEDEDHDKVIVASDSDLVAAVDHARQSGWKSLRLHLDYSGLDPKKKGHGSGDLDRVCRYGCMGSCIQLGCSRCSANCWYRSNGLLEKISIINTSGSTPNTLITTANDTSEE